ncbi:MULTISPECIES: DUF4286 family protein [unclassified Legionella]|uniref:DUF4286 family protein n=1 Tax=unclassified Legionella TaxID=2622702 RepID=UPI0010558700|nr:MULTISPECIES: DUF4286 family protein [unclassified Legionella]MDI9818156.1 DUF4286 family protein [Legionella sp. PL877]
MLIYEVNLEINSAIFDDYLAWLGPHIQEILKYEGFVKADLLFNHDIEEGIRKITVAYYLQDEDSYHHYLDHHAVKMRADAGKWFNGQFKATRRLLEVVETYLPN